MTVMPSSSDVADKAVSTEDASSGVEVARLEAVLAALVETKVEAMKASAAAAATSARRAGSAPPSPRRPRLTSSSTVSSSQNHHGQHHHHHPHHHPHHHHHHHHHQHRPRQDRSDKAGRHARRHRRHGSAPCGDFGVEDPIIAHHRKQRHGKGKHKSALDGSPRSTRRPRSQSRSPLQALSRDAEHPDLESRFELDAALIQFDRTSGREVLSDSCEAGDPRLHQSACYISHSTAQLSFYDEYPSFDFADDVEEDEETLSGPAGLMPGAFGALALPADSHQSELQGYLHRHRPRRKRRRRKRRKERLVDVEGVELELGVVDPDDLPPRARWTIVATACLLLAMSLLLVGVTLRMAPIIDEMVRKENEELLNSLNRDSSAPVNTTHATTSLPP